MGPMSYVLCHIHRTQAILANTRGGVSRGRAHGIWHMDMGIWAYGIGYIWDIYQIANSNRPLGAWDQLRDQRGQRRRYWPPFAPWVQ
jgi:hypothetical protein